MDAFYQINAGKTLDVIAFCNGLDDVATTAQKYDTLELCMKVVSADGTARESEFKIINDIAKSLEIDMDKFRSMIDKIIPVNIHEVEDAARLLGIPHGATTDQKKAHLRNEYKKWNPLVTHSDPKIREQAAKMLELIARERSKLS